MRLLQPISHPRKPRQRRPNLPLPRPTRSIQNPRDLKAIKPTRRANRICPHPLEPQPVPNLQPRRKRRVLAYLINRVAGGAPDGAGGERLGGGDVEGGVEREDVREGDGVVEHKAVEGAVYAVVDVV